MHKNSDALNWIERKDLSNQIFNIYKFGFLDNDFEKEKFSQSFSNHVLNRIGVLYSLSNYVLIEEDYVENEWKVMVANHYINSAYADKLRTHVIRIHFLSDRVFSSQNYLGFITLRPIEEIEISLSFIYMNWEYRFFSTPTYVMTYNKDINFKGKKITIKTYPFFSQDSIVTCCADVNIIMVGRYLSNKYGFSNVMLSDLVKNSNKFLRRMPRVVSINDVQDLLSSISIPYLVYRIESDNELIEYIIDAYIESAIPVIMFIGDHVVQIIGHMDNSDESEMQYIIYDDSGYLEKKLSLSPTNKKTFYYNTTIKRIKEYLQSMSTSQKKARGFLIVPMFDKVYVDIVNYLKHLRFHISRLTNYSNGENLLKSFVFPNFGGETDSIDSVNAENESLNKISIRNMLVDNSQLKTHIKNKVLPSLISTFIEDKPDGEFVDSLFDSSNITNLLNSPLSHYNWYTEFRHGDECICLCADTTMFYATSNDQKLFLHFEPTYVDADKTLLLLTKSN